MNNQRVKVAVIGGGIFGTNHLKVFRQLEYENRCQLVALAEINPNVLRKQKDTFRIEGYLDYKKMLQKEEIEAVSIVTPDYLHRQIVLNVARAGKHILVEKPMDMTIKGCQEMIEAAKKNSVLLQVDFHKRFDAAHQELESAIREGRLGNIQYGYVHMEDRIEVPHWWPDWASKSSPVWFLGVHFFDLIRWLLKSNARRIYATGVKEKLKQSGIDSYDSIQAKVEFENGASVTFDSSWILPNQFEAVTNQGLRLVGTKGIWEIDTQDRGSRSSLEEGMKTYNSHFFLKHLDKKGRIIYNGYCVESIKDFIENIICLREGINLEDLKSKALYPSGEDGLEVTKMAVAVHRSIEERRIIEL